MSEKQYTLLKGDELGIVDGDRVLKHYMGEDKHGVKQYRDFPIDECVVFMDRLYPIDVWCVEKRFTGKIDEDTGRMMYDKDQHKQVSIKVQHTVRLELTVKFRRFNDGHVVASRKWITNYQNPARGERKAEWSHFFPCPIRSGSDDNTFTVFLELIDAANEYMEKIRMAEKMRNLAEYGVGSKSRSSRPQRQYHSSGGHEQDKEGETREENRRPQKQGPTRGEILDRVDPTGQTRRYHETAKIPIDKTSEKHVATPPPVEQDVDKTVVAGRVRQLEDGTFVADEEELAVNKDFDIDAENAALEEKRAREEKAAKDEEKRRLEGEKLKDRTEKVEQHQERTRNDMTSEERIKRSDEKFVKQLKRKGHSKEEIKKLVAARQVEREKRSEAEAKARESAGSDFNYDEWKEKYEANKREEVERKSSGTKVVFKDGKIEKMLTTGRTQSAEPNETAEPRFAEDEDASPMTSPEDVDAAFDLTNTNGGDTISTSDSDAHDDDKEQDEGEEKPLIEMEMPELKVMATELGVKIRPKDGKKDLIKKIQAAMYG
jgi:hypothetical protein